MMSAHMTVPMTVAPTTPIVKRGLHAIPQLRTVVEAKQGLDGYGDADQRKDDEHANTLYHADRSKRVIRTDGVESAVFDQHEIDKKTDDGAGCLHGERRGTQKKECCASTSP